ncbi:hypothetical protein ACIROH_23045 [Bacillus subtilis]|uniref:hypothetical protein n=1 Tax=Bacillus subtilis TaxID=1423 RepID=UPI002DB71904|nr:hypothetical protein [Bacillus subtilis]MEC2218830.1 hypothetical protein [Bacillus subtilis]
MNWLEFWSSIIKSAIWPFVIVTTLWMFRKPVNELFSNLADFTLKFKDFEATYSKDLQNVKNKLEGADTDKPESEGSETDEKQTPKNSNADWNSSIIVNNDGSNADFFKIASEAPYLATIMSFQLLEQELRSTIKKLGIKLVGIQNTPRSYMKHLVDKGYLESKHLEAFRELSSLRNFAVHNPSEAKKISYMDAMTYDKLTKRLISRLKKININ